MIPETPLDKNEISIKVKHRSFMLYVLLGGLFITALVACNLIANKFVTVNLGFYTFVLSAGVLPYPLTFLITDILSEIYGRAKTNMVVLVGFVASLFVLLILWMGGQFDSIPNSPVTNDDYNTVFQNSWRVILASMVAYLIAQLIDVRMFHFWKRLTRGKKLWLRNNASTVVSQLVDTTLVVLVLFIGREDAETMAEYIRDGWAFKAMCALIDTLFIYIIIGYIRKVFRLKIGEEVDFL